MRTTFIFHLIKVNIITVNLFYVELERLRLPD